MEKEHQMDTNSDAKNEQGNKDIHPFYDAARRILLAGIGAIAISHDEIEEFIDKLVERGEIARKDKESLMKEIRERRKKYFHSEENLIQKRMDKFFEHFNVPAKKDIDDLSEKISALEKKIDELTKSKK
jgi:poly(hydroxyalkanoate) granule-associated protein